MKTAFGYVVALIALLATSMPAKAELAFRYADSFTATEQVKLESWIREVHAGVQELVGAYPFPIRITFERTRSDSPVPWAQTERGRVQGVRFYVDPRFSLDELRGDWTAAHELSHLTLPFVGRRNAWFSEGFASFMQYQVMVDMGVITADQARKRYLAKLGAAQREYAWDHLRFVDTTPQLRARRQYPVMYWGGAVFFFRLNAALESAGQITLLELVSQYMACCRTNRSQLNELIADLDAVLPRPVVAQEFERFISIVGFPDFTNLDVGAITRDQ